MVKNNLIAMLDNHFVGFFGLVTILASMGRLAEGGARRVVVGKAFGPCLVGGQYA